MMSGLRFKFGKQSAISTLGLDIGSYAIKCVEMKKENEKIVLESAEIVKLTSNSHDNVTTSLRQIAHSKGASIKKLRVAVSGPAVFIRNVTLPRMTQQELKSAIRFEAERHVPFPIDDCVIDFQVLGYTSNKLSMKVLLVVVKKDYIDQQVKLLKDAGLEPEIIDVEVFSFVNAFEALTDETAATTYGLLNIGHELSSFAIVHNRELFFAREMLFGGYGIAKALAELKGISEEAADQCKKKKEPKDQQDLVRATQRGFEPLVEELKRSIDYFENETAEDLKVIFIAGGGARAQAAADVFSEELGKKVALWSFPKKIEVADNVNLKFVEENFAELPVAYGLALRGMK